MANLFFKPNRKLEFNADPRSMATILIIFCLLIFQFPCIAAGGSGEAIQLYDSEMLLRDLDNKSGTCSDAQKPLVHTDDKNQVTIEVPRSINYNTTLLEEGAKLYRAGNFHEAAIAFESILKQFRMEKFVEGETAVLGNLYLTYLAMGNEEKALEYLEEYRKKRRRK
jgi:tetratricopeptide (TPR) repeat protein